MKETELSEKHHQYGLPEKYLNTLRDDRAVLQGLSEACQAGLTHLMSYLSLMLAYLF